MVCGNRVPWLKAKNTVVCGKDYRGLWQGLPWFVARITVVCGKDYRGLWQKNREGAG